MFMAPFTAASQSCDPNRCKICFHTEPDVRILGCGCQIHARCVPLNLVVSEASLRNNETKPVTPNTLLCPACRQSSVAGIYIHPLSTKDLDSAVALRKDALKEKEGKTSSGVVDADQLAIQAETSYLLLSHNQGSGTVSADHEYQRTGRWTDEEVNYVDFLVEGFDNGRIPVEHGLKLNEFLAEILLCKSSRLTKKMKNARLSIRSYNFTSPVPRLDVEVMSSLEQKFLDSISSEASRLELKFNISRLWRTHLSNLCLQVGSPLLDANDWIASLEDMERRASDAEERLRKARRRRMGLALRTDSRTDQDGVFFGGVPVQRPPKKPKLDKPMPAAVSSNATAAGAPAVEAAKGSPRLRPSDPSTSSSTSVASSDEEGEGGFISTMLDLGAHHVDTGVDDYSKILDDLASNSQPAGMPTLVRKNCGPFLEELVNYIENNNLPFQHVDVWVPSYRPSGENSSELRLFHAGFGTCQHNIDSPTIFQLDEYGEYSTRFSFASGVGLPGRVFSTGKPVWERHLDEADPKFFERAGGAKVYGVRTGFGFPMRTAVIGLIVVSMYSVNDLIENASLVEKCSADLSKLCPEPKWKLVVDMGSNNNKAAGGNDGEAAVRHPGTLVVHHQHSSEGGGATEEQNVEHQIASMLGEYMPLSDIAAPGEPTQSYAAPHALVPHFMSLRLLLLRSKDRRTEEEKEMVEVIKKSYQGYNDGRRGKRDLALLLVRDWQFLKNSNNSTNEMDARKPAARAPVAPVAAQLQGQQMQVQVSQQHQSHILEAPLVSTFASTGAPVVMPKALPFMDPSAVRRASMERVTRERGGSDASAASTGNMTQSNNPNNKTSNNINIVENP